jgi:hypothetical protein
MLRRHLEALAMLSFAAAMIAAAPGARAADLSVSPAGVHVVHHARLRLVRDYDGTPIVIRPRPDGTADAAAVPRAQPHHYLNGEPVGGRSVIR